INVDLQVIGDVGGYLMLKADEVVRFGLVGFAPELLACIDVDDFNRYAQRVPGLLRCAAEHSADVHLSACGGRVDLRSLKSPGYCPGCYLKAAHACDVICEGLSDAGAHVVEA